jgi:hypothetical protein
VRAEGSGWRRAFRILRRVFGRIGTVRCFADAGLIEDRRARERAMNLLLQYLTPAQRAEFERTCAFKVRGRSGQLYRITYATTANIEVLEQPGMVIRRLCAGPLGVPIPDVMLAQKLMLEADESEFLRIAARLGDNWGDPLYTRGP